MTTRNLYSNSVAHEIWPFGVLMEALASDKKEDPSLEEKLPQKDPSYLIKPADYYE